MSVGPKLGQRSDEELDAVASAAASGDGGDEDGLLSSSLLRGQASSVSLEVSAESSTARLDAWIDFNHDGKFTADEKFSDSRLPSNVSGRVTSSPPPKSARTDAIPSSRIVNRSRCALGCP